MTAVHDVGSQEKRINALCLLETGDVPSKTSPWDDHGITLEQELQSHELSCAKAFENHYPGLNEKEDTVRGKNLMVKRRTVSKASSSFSQLDNQFHFIQYSLIMEMISHSHIKMQIKRKAI